MWQWLALDRPARGAYYAVALAGALGAAACAVTIPRLGPERLPPVERGAVTEWVREFHPTRAVRFDLRWTYRTQQGTSRGRAAVRFVPPDSVRFDYRAPFGKSGAAVIVGDDVVWSRPEDDVGRLVQVAPLFWAALGMPRVPPEGWGVSGLAEGDVRTWRYAAPGDTLTYRARAAVPGASLKAQMRSAGQVVGAVEVVFADSVLQPVSSTMVFPGSASTVEFTVVAIEPITAVDPEIWKAP
jgi:hypothetical protein